MKKVISAFLLTLFITVAASSCTDENIKPQDGVGGHDCAQGWCK